MVSQITDSGVKTICLKIPVVPPFLKIQKPTLNEFSIPVKEFYSVQDLSQILKVQPDTLRHRFIAGHYPEPARMSNKRVFTLQELRNIVSMSKIKE